MAAILDGLTKLARTAQPALSAGQAEALRDELARLGAPDGLAASPSIAILPAELRRVLEALDQRLARAETIAPEALDARFGAAYAAVVGLDHLGALRELGGDQADHVTTEITHRIVTHIPGAVLRRVGRSTLEFMFRSHDPAEVRARLEALLRALDRRVSVGAQDFDLVAAIGYAQGPPGLRCDERLIELAQLALARARAGAQKLALYDAAVQAERTDRLELMRDLRAALDTEAVYLCYQPKLDARTNRTVAAEALIRWRHPVRGMVPPDAFIGLAEQTGEIRAITERVIRRALIDQRRLRAAGLPMAVHVNVSGALFCDDRFAAWALEHAAEAVDTLGFEITETAVIPDPARAVAHMRAFAAAGVEIAIDDYGSGLSSLAYLKELPAQELKIDKSFVMGLATTGRDPLIVRSTIDLAHALEMRVTAEGVDNPTARALLTRMGCDLLQGYGISPPLKIDELAAFVRREAAQAEPPADVVRLRAAAG